MDGFIFFMVKLPMADNAWISRGSPEYEGFATQIASKKDKNAKKYRKSVVSDGLLLLGTGKVQTRVCIIFRKLEDNGPKSEANRKQDAKKSL